jgi:hypothetical protein
MEYSRKIYKNLMKLNWSNALLVLVLALLASMANDKRTIEEALIIWIICGIPVFLFVLIAGREK